MLFRGSAVKLDQYWRRRELVVQRPHRVAAGTSRPYPLRFEAVHFFGVRIGLAFDDLIYSIKRRCHPARYAIDSPAVTTQFLEHVEVTGLTRCEWKPASRVRRRSSSCP